MKRIQGLAWLAALCVVAGCVERRFIITTEPFGAIVYDEKGMPVSASPADRQFTYYGKYRFTLVRDGYQTMVVEENVKAPWYEVFPLDFISENLVPFTIRDVRHFNYQLQPAQVVSPDAVFEQAQQRRAYGKTKGVPLAVPPSNPAPVPLLPPVVDPAQPPPPVMPPPR
jgi:hypothetical protein